MHSKQCRFTIPIPWSSGASRKSTGEVQYGPLMAQFRGCPHAPQDQPLPWRYHYIHERYGIRLLRYIFHHLNRPVLTCDKILYCIDIIVQDCIYLPTLYGGIVLYQITAKCVNNMLKTRFTSIQLLLHTVCYPLQLNKMNILCLFLGSLYVHSFKDTFQRSVLQEIVKFYVRHHHLTSFLSSWRCN